jgi:glycerol kinase
MDQYILAIDQGTSSSRAIIFNQHSKIIAVSQKEFTQHFPHPGWVEHDANEIWSSQYSVFTEVIQKANLKPQDIKAIGITNQRETTVVWDRKTGQPIYHAIVWQDRRTAEFCAELKSSGFGEHIQRSTGLLADPYFSGTKLKWILENVKGAADKASKGELAFGTVDSWLIYKLTGGKIHATDVSNASRTLLFNIHTLKWDEEILRKFNIPTSILPEVKNSVDDFGTVDQHLLPHPIPICGVAGDQQAALFGQKCYKKGMVKNTYGTGCFTMLNTGSVPVNSKNKLLTTIGWKIGDETTYALEGSVFIGGAVIQWLRDGLEIIKQSADVEVLANSVKDSDGVYFVPALSGLGAPWWDPNATGMISGITRGTTKAHIARAAVESIALQSYDLIDCMQKDLQEKISELKVDGGATTNQTLMQFQADLIQTTVSRPEIQETTALGACYLAGLGIGVWKSLEDIASTEMSTLKFKPQLSEHEADIKIDAWHKAVKQCMGAGN